MQGARYNQIARLLPLVATLLLGGCNWGVLDPQGPIGEAERSLIIEATLLILVIVVPLMVLMGAFVWRYCASHARAKYMPDWEHSNAVAAVMVLTPVTGGRHRRGGARLEVAIHLPAAARRHGQ
jgi:cytochrome o ubiquinol oxidase subunit II